MITIERNKRLTDRGFLFNESKVMPYGFPDGCNCCSSLFYPSGNRIPIYCFFLYSVLSNGKLLKLWTFLSESEIST